MDGKIWKVKKDEITEKECNRKFKMGENIYLSNKEITLLVRMKTDNDGFMRKMVTVSVVDRDDELFLCGLKTLMEWKAAQAFALQKNCLCLNLFYFFSL